MSRMKSVTAAALVGLLAVAGLTGRAAAQTTASITATANVTGFAPLTASGVSNLDFGAVTAGTPKAPTSLSANAGRFNISGQVSTPVTVKTRLGWDSESIKIVDVAKMVEQVGAKALTIHCRTRAQGHKGEPDFSWIPRVKEAVSIPIFVNGGLDTPEKIAAAFQETKCDGVMIGQAAINNPWIFRQARHYLVNKELLPPPDLNERVSVLLEHLRLSVEQKGEKRAVLEFRKHYTGYLRDLPNVSRVRSELMHFTEMPPIVDHLRSYVEWLKSSQNVPARI